MKKLFLFIFLIVSLQSKAWAESELTEMTKMGNSQNASEVEAKKDIVKDAVQAASEQLITSMIGEARMLKNKGLIERKVVQNYLKYMPIVKIGPIQKNEQGSAAEVSFKIATESLRQILLKEGLLYELEGTPKVLPFIGILDKVNSKSYNWWVNEELSDRAYLKSVLQTLHEGLRTELWNSGFYCFQPTRNLFPQVVPKDYRIEKPRNEDLLSMGPYFEASIVVKGLIKIQAVENVNDKFNIDVRLEALQTSNGRVIAEVIRQFDTEAGPFQQVINKTFNEVNDQISKDLVSQIVEAFQKGTFGSSLLELTLNGTYNYQQIKSFRDEVKTKINSIRGLRERLFTPNSVVFEVDSSVTSNQLASLFKDQEFSSIKVEVEGVSGNGLALSLKSR